LRDDLLRRTNALKFIISSRDEQYNHVPELGQSAYGIPVYVQPMDEYDELRNAQNRALAVRLAMQYGYRLSMQLHKILGIE
jgi:7-carboxy-7-deazaguanine synthase